MDTNIIRLLTRHKNEKEILLTFPRTGNYKSKNHRPFIRVKKGENFYTFTSVRNANKYEYDKNDDLPFIYMDIKTGKKWRLTFNAVIAGDTNGLKN